MTSMNVEGIGPEVADIRVDPDVAELLVRSTVGRLAAGRVAARLEKEPGFLLGAIRMAQDIVVCTTLAQTLKPDADFGAVVAGRKFAAGDEDLGGIGNALLSRVFAAQRLEDKEISAEVLAGREVVIRTAVAGR